MKQYWLSINPDVFIWTKEEKGLVYNCRNYKFVHFCCTGELQHLINHLIQIDNLYGVEISEQTLSDAILADWIKKLQNMDAALLVENNGKNAKPVSFKPQVKIQDSIPHYKLQHQLGKEGDIISNLHKLVVHMNGTPFGNDEYSEQIPYPRKENQNLQLTDIVHFIKTYGDIRLLSEIVLIGCPCTYPQYDELVSFLRAQYLSPSIYCTQEDYVANEKTFITKEDVTFHVLIHNYQDNLCKLLESTLSKDSVCVDFVVNSDEDCEQAYFWIEKYNLEKSRIYPVYTGENLSFLEDNLYLDEEDIKEIHLSKREIFARQVLNTNFFGVFTILPDGRVLADGKLEVGSIKEDLYTLIFREMTEGKSWFHTREYSPCNKCVYQYLCPSPSNYERALNRANLCHLTIS